MKPHAPTAEPPILLTIPAAAELLGIGRSTLYELIAAGRVPVVHLGRSARVHRDDIDAFVAAIRGSTTIGRSFTAQGRSLAVLEISLPEGPSNAPDREGAGSGE